MKTHVKAFVWIFLFASVNISWRPLHAPKKLKIADSIAAVNTALLLYEEMELEKAGLSLDAFNYAYKGYQKLLTNKSLKNTDYLTICDFSQSSRSKRFYLLDMVNKQIEHITYVAHGKNSGGEYATRFSNKPQSLQSSLGFYVTANTYYGEHGYSLRMQGIEKGHNDKALHRNIVIHGADYIEEDWLKRNNSMGRSFGCPALPEEESSAIIDKIKTGTCLFVYHPTNSYLKSSKLLND